MMAEAAKVERCVYMGCSVSLYHFRRPRQSLDGSRGVMSLNCPETL